MPGQTVCLGIHLTPAAAHQLWVPIAGKFFESFSAGIERAANAKGKIVPALGFASIEKRLRAARFMDLYAGRSEWRGTRESLDWKLNFFANPSLRFVFIGVSIDLNDAETRLISFFEEAVAPVVSREVRTAYLFRRQLQRDPCSFVAGMSKRLSGDNYPTELLSAWSNCIARGGESGQIRDVFERNYFSRASDLKYNQELEAIAMKVGAMHRVGDFLCWVVAERDIPGARTSLRSAGLLARG